jgi:hypothetical protein
MLRYHQRVAQPAQVGEPLPALYNEQWAQDAGMRRRIQEQISELAQQGLLVPFRQHNTLYYTLPTLVRSQLPAQPGLVQPYTEQADTLEIKETPFGVLVHKLFATWNAIWRGASGPKDPPRRHSDRPRQPIEDQWPLLRGWDHEPSEISLLLKNQYSRGQASAVRLDRVSAAALNWAVTIPLPPLRLQERDREFVRTQVQGTDNQVDFYYALLESLGALSGEPGEVIAVHRDALQRFLRRSASGKIRALWQSWIADQPWTEMQAVLRRDGQAALRLRRSLAQRDYKAEDLYHDWDSGRKTVLRLLSLVPPDRWFSIDGLLKAIFDVRPNLLHSTSDPSVWWLESTRTRRQFGTAFEDWQQSYGQFVASMLQGPLAWLGVVRLGYAPAGVPEQDAPRPVAFQLTEVGAFALGRRSELLASRPTDALPDKACCSISPDLVLTLVPDRAPLELHDLLHTVGRLLEATPDRFSYQLTADGISGWLASSRAAESGPPPGAASMDALIALLGKHCHTSSETLDQASDETWRDKLYTWERNRGLLHLYENITLIELADDYALQELLISTSLADHLVHQFSPRLVAIWADSIPTLVEEMEQRGYTPRLR